MRAVPDVMEFSDPVVFLRALLQSGWGLRELAKEAGLRSSATISMILHGKRRLTIAAAEKIAGALGLSDRRKAYLLLLAGIGYAKNEEERHVIWERALKLKSLSDVKALPLRQYRCLSIWYYPVIYSLVAMSDFNRDPEWVAKRLGRNITSRMVRQALGDLLNLGLIEDKGGKLVQALGALSTKEEIKDLGVRRYHQQMLELAKESINVPMELRELNGLTIGLSPERIGEVKARIRNFRSELNQYLSQFDDAGEVYQLNIHLFPLTQRGES